MESIYIVNGARTAFGEFGGSFKNVSDIDLAVTTAKGALERSGIWSNEIDDVSYGNVIHTSTSSSYLARHIALKAGVAIESPALTLNRLCGSGMQAVISTVQNILYGNASVGLVGGTENMSQAPHVLRGTRFGTPNKAPDVDDMLWGTLTDNYIGCGMGVTAENLATKYSITREEQDLYAYNSHRKAIEAAQSGRFAEEIVPVKFLDRRKKEIEITEDEHIRKDISTESLARLKPAFKKEGSVTAGNASGINDGAASLVVASESYLNKNNNVEPMARIVSWGIAGVDPNIMGIGPVPATKIALKNAGLTWNDMDVIELNEAFAAQSLAVMKELDVNPDLVNVNGGAIALGHPVGASGARVIYSLTVELKKRNAKYGIASLCIGGGQGIAMVIENVSG